MAFQTAQVILTCDTTYYNNLFKEVTPHIIEGNHQATISVLSTVNACNELTFQELDEAIQIQLIGAKNYLTEAHLKLFQFEEAKIYLDQLTEHFADLNSRHPSVPIYRKIFHALFGEYYMNVGFHELATYFYEKTIDEIFEDVGYNETGSLDTEGVYDVYYLNALDLFNNAALNHTKVGNFEKATLYYKTALEFSYDPQSWQNTIVHQNLAWSYSQIGDFENAAIQFDMLENNLPELLSPDQRNALGIAHKNKAEYFSRINKLDSCFLYIEKALSFDLIEENKIYVQQLNAEVLLKSKQFLQAFDKIRQAKESTKNILGEMHPEMSDNFLIEAKIFAEQEEYEKSDSLANKALAILHQKQHCDCSILSINDIVDKSRALEILHFKAKNLINIEDHEEVDVCYSSASKLVQLLQTKFLLDPDSKYNLAKRAKQIYGDAVKYHFLSGDYQQSYHYARLAKGMVLLQNLQDKKAVEAGFVPKELVAEGKNLKIQINQLRKEIQSFKEDDANARLQDNESQIIAIENEYENWLKNLEASYPLYYSMKYENNLQSIEQIQDALSRQGENLIEYFLSDQDLFIFCSTPTALYVEVKELSNGFVSDIFDLNQIIRSNSYDLESFNRFCRKSNALYATLIQPIYKHLRPGELLNIIPDEEINLVPFEALMTKPYSSKDKVEYHQLQYFLEDFDISYHYSSNFISGFDHTINGVNISAFAPSFEGSDLPILPFNEEEAKITHALFEGDVHIGEQANVENFRRAMDTSNIVHLATHAIFNDEIPLDSRLELQDSSVFIYQLYNMSHDLDLLVMSACETASGKTQKGEGVISLSRALIESGCPSIVSSLWEVSDQKAMVLMENFYNNFKQGEDSASALAASKRSFLDSAISRNTQPFYWAQFIHIGKPLSIKSKWQKPLIISSIILCLFLLIRKSVNKK